MRLCQKCFKKQSNFRNPEEDLAYFIRRVVDFMYLFCVCPFRLAPGSTNVMQECSCPTSLIPRKWWFQSIIYVISSIFAVVQCVGDVRSFNLQKPEKASTHFSLLYEILTIPELLLWMYVMLWNPHLLANPANFICNFRYNKVPPVLAERWVKLKLIFICTFCIISITIAISTTFTYSYEAFTDFEVNDVNSWWLTMIWEGKHMLFFQNKNETTPLLFGANADTFYGTVGIAGVLSR